VQVRVPVSVGELLDKISILRIKEQRIAAPAKLVNVRRELSALQPEMERIEAPAHQLEDWLTDLDRVNGALWEIEDDIRACEARSDFGENFVRLARAVYRTNDERASIKRRINEATGSDLVEEKSYVDPDTGAGSGD
jgi:predicted  nucleic acid-binding Zn-ribbon protein